MPNLIKMAARKWFSSAAKLPRPFASKTRVMFGNVLAQLRTLVTVDLKRLEDSAEAAGAPWTSGRIPTWDATGSAVGGSGTPRR